MGLGGGYAKFDGSFGATDAKISGGGPALELLIGGALTPGVVLGGGFVFMSLNKPTLTARGTDSESNNDLSYGIIGLFGDFYPDPNGGFHFGGMLGFANAIPDTNSGNTASVSGAGAYLGAGYDFWIADQWSVGPNARFLWSSVKNDDPFVDEKYTVTGFQILASFTYQ